MDNRLYVKFIRFLAIILLFFSLGFVIKYTFMYIYPFLIAILIAFLLHPLVTKMEVKWKLNRTIATSFVMICFFTLFFTVCFFILKQLLKESSALIETLPEQFKYIKLLLSDIGQTYMLPYYERLSNIVTILPSPDEWNFSNYLNFFMDELGASSSFFLKNIVLTTSNVLTSLSYVATISFFILLAVFFMTKDFELITFHFRHSVPTKLLWKLGQIVMHLKISVFGFVKAQIIITVISSIIVMIGLFIFQVENILIVTLTVFFVDFIPYVGIGAVFIPWLVYNFFTEQYVLTIQLSGLYFIIIVVRQLIEPRILASSIGIHPLIALMILFIGIESLGLIGIFISPIILIGISAIYHAGIIHFIWRFIKHG